MPRIKIELEPWGRGWYWTVEVEGDEFRLVSGEYRTNDEAEGLWAVAPDPAYSNGNVRSWRQVLGTGQFHLRRAPGGRSAAYAKIRRWVVKGLEG